MLLKVGDKFGRYRIEGLLGEGGMGSVFRAFDTTLERHVALKIVRDDGAPLPAGAAPSPGTGSRPHDRLLREARAAAGIAHVNAIAIHDVGAIDDVTYIAMELVNGRSLRAYVGDGSVPMSTRVRWLLDVARALDAAHARGMVHRDVKPENVMVRDDGVVKVLDFGIASSDGGLPSGVRPGPLFDRAGDTSDIAAGGHFLGTPSYMAPEQLRSEAVDARADQFAWGVVAYELLSGVRPWTVHAVTLSAFLDLHSKAPMGLRDLAPNVPALVARVVHRAIDEDPANRFGSMAALIQELGDDAVPRDLGSGPRSLVPGDVVGHRFEIERFAAAGGMGAVYRAIDRDTGAPAALKVMTRGGTDRFLREARILAELTHPRIVRHLAHGALPGGDLFLAMEWLKGEELSRRLERGPMSIAEGVAVAKAVADALTAAHARGVTHRDLKPGNLFLVDGQVEGLRVLDFGAARLDTTAARSVASTVFGTPGYMAPEQVRGERTVDGRADVFSLGCVLFECLSGRPLFMANHVLALLGKILFEEAPPLREVVPEAPPGLEELVKRMLAKDPADRPAGGADLLRALDALGPLDPAAATAAPLRTRVTERERRLVTIVLASVPTDARLGDSIRERARTVATRFDAEVAWAREGSMIVVLSPRGTARDQAAAAARCALAVAGELPDARVVVSTSRGEISGPPLGEVIDRAAALLAVATPEARIRVDSGTVSLLDARFDIEDKDGIHVLSGERLSEGVRTLFGRPSPCVGREKELALLEATYDECASERAARAVLVVGEAGVGKSRLRHEMRARLRGRSPEPQVILAHADVVSAGSPLSLARQIVASAAGLHEADAPSVRRRKIGARLGGRVPETDARWVVEFLGELFGGDRDAPASDELRVARGDPAMMGVWLRRAFERWLGVECLDRPLAIVLDDLHWGDAASVALLGGALLHVRERRVFVLALARPEIRDVFPRLWAGLELQTLQLLPLSRGASEKLVRAVLGERVSGDTIARVVERAGGNAFFLEELMRHTSTDRESHTMPSTVLAMVESRIARLDAPLRRALRAASVFGRTLWAGGVRALLGASSTDAVAADLDALVAAELLVPGAGARFVREREYAFRHDLVRDAAAAMLTSEDEATAHRLAAEWLVSAGERDPIVLAGHFEKGGDAVRAVEWLVRAAQDASEGLDSAGVHTLVKRAVGLGASGEALGRLRLSDAIAWVFERTMSEVHPAAMEALRLVPRDRPEWFLAASLAAFSGIETGNVAAVFEIIVGLVDAKLEDWPTGPAGMAAMVSVSALVWSGQRDAAIALLQRLDAIARPGGETALSRPGDAGPGDVSADAGSLDAGFIAWRLMARMQLHFYWSPNLETLMREGREASRIFERLGNPWGLAMALGFLSMAENYAKDPRALATARTAVDVAPVRFLQHQNEVGLALTLMTVGGHDDEALSLFEAQVRELDPIAVHTPRSWLALLYLQRGDAAAAEREARIILEYAVGLPFPQVFAKVLLAEVALARGHAAEALANVDEALAIVAASLEPPVWGTAARAARVEALMRLGRREEGLGALEEARAILLRLAGTLEDEAARRRFLHAPSNARTLDLAAQHLGPGEKDVESA